MKNTALLAVGSLLMCACGLEEEKSSEPVVTPLAAEVSSGLSTVQLTVACSHGTCRDDVALEPSRTQQAPSTLAYSTFLGFSGDDYAQAVAVDSSGNAYFIGTTRTPDTRTTNVFVAKMGPTGQNIYYTYFPGGEAKSIAVDGSGNAYIVAGTSSGIVVAKLNPSGSAFVYYTFMPQILSYLEDIAVDAQGNAYITGYSYQGTTKDNDVAVGKLNASGSAFHYLVTFGGSKYDAGRSLAIDTSGNVYIAGDSHSSNFPLLNAFQTAFSGGTSTVASKLNAAGTALVYSTYLGGPGDGSYTRNLDLAVDWAGSAYVAGETNSSRFPVTPGAAQSADPDTGYNDGYVTKLNTTGGVVYSTYFGGRYGDKVTGIVVDDSSGDAYLTGQTSGGLLITGNAYQSTCYGVDTFVAQLSSWGGSISYASYLGGSSYDSVSYSLHHNIALDPWRNVYVVGDTQSTNFPTTVYPYAGGVDAFITKFYGP
jgi:hypothetical protein